MVKKKKASSEDPSGIFHTMDQTLDSQKVSRQLSEIHDLKQDPDAPLIAGYMLLKPIGRGAYAQVWEALQLRTRKFVAIKVFTKKTGVHWFYLQREADRLIRLDKHPHIVSLLDADLSGEIPYYVMDLAQEGSLERFIESGRAMDGSPLEVEEVAVWMKEIAQALHYVHSKQMVHCDLKPANVLLDEEGHVRVADFGNSRVLSDSGGALGTLFFMAPEQAVAPGHEDSLQPDPRWDLYALGCTIYSVLSNHVPHGEIGDKLEMAPGVEERLKIYRQAIADQPLSDLFTLTKGAVDRDLSAIVEKCMRNRPQDRYASIDGVLEDLRNRHEGRPVSPLAGNLVYWLGKFFTRYRTSVVVAALSILVTLFALTAVDRHKKAQVQDLALNYVLRGREFLDREDEASAVAYFTASNKMFPSLLARGNAVAHMPPIPSRFFAHDGSVVAVAYSPDGKILMTAGGSTGARLLDGSTGRALGVPLKLDGPLSAAAFSPDGTQLALGDSQGNAQIFNVAEQKPQGNPFGQKKAITSICFSRDGSKVLTASADGRAREWDARTGRPLKAVMEHDRPLYSAVLNSSGDRVLTVDKEGAVQLWDADSGNARGDQVDLDLKGAPAWYQPDVAFQPEGRGFLTTGWDGAVKFYDDNARRKGRPIFLEGLGAKALFSPDGRTLLTSVVYGGSTGMARVWSARTHVPRRFALRTSGKITALAFNDEGTEILTGGTDHVVRVWSALTGAPLGHAFCQGDVVTAAAFHPDGQTLVTGCKDGLACLWRLDPEEGDPAHLDWKKSGREHLRKIQVHAIFSPDGRKVLTYGGRTLCLWDATTGAALGVVMTAGGTILRAVFSPDGASLLTCDRDNEARLWNLSKGRFIALGHDKAVRGGAFSVDGKRVLTGGEDKTLRLWKTATGEEWGMPVGTGMEVTKALLSSDGKRMVALGSRGEFRLYPVEKGQPTPVIWSKKGVKNIAFTPDGRGLLVAGSTAVTFLEASTGKITNVFVHGQGLVSILLDPKGRLVATSGTDGTIRLWDLKTGLPTCNPLKHDGPLQDWTFSPRGGALLAVYQNGGRQWWDTSTGEVIGDETGHVLPTRALSFDPEGKSLSLLDRDGGILRIGTDWVDPTTDPDWLVLESKVAGRCQVNVAGSLEPIVADSWVRLWNQWVLKDKK